MPFNSIVDHQVLWETGTRPRPVEIFQFYSRSSWFGVVELRINIDALSIL